MSEPTYDLFFTGQLLDGFYEDFVKADLKILFKTDDTYVDRLFNGRTQTLKTNVDKATAIRFQQAFKKAGAKLIVRPHTPRAEVSKATSEPDSSNRADKSPIQTASTNLTVTDQSVQGENSDELIEHHQPPLKAPEAVPSWDVSSPGALLSENQPVTHAEAIDTSHFSLAPTGSILGNDSDDLPLPDVSTDHLSVAPPGETIPHLDDEKTPVQVDTSHLSVSK